MRRLAGILLPALAVVMGTASCGKKSEPLPPVPPIPARTTDLKVEQQGSTAELSFSFPSQKMDGTPLSDLDRVEIYRVEGAAASLARTAPPTATGGTSSDRAPISGRRRRAQAGRMRERSFLEAAKKLAVLRSDLFPSATRGGSLLYHDALDELLKASGPAPPELGYAVVTVRRNGLRSEISNIATLQPVSPPAAPLDLLAVPEENRVCLSWTAPPPPKTDEKPELAGYNVYRRRLEEEDYGRPVNPAPVESTDYADTSAAYGSTYVYTVTAVPKGHSNAEGPPAIQFGIAYEDVYPPSAVSRLDALPEEGLVRLDWTPVEANDLAGYDLYRSVDGSAEARVNAKPMTETSYVDSDVRIGSAYRYRVRSVDKRGNASAPSPAAEARPFSPE